MTEPRNEPPARLQPAEGPVPKPKLGEGMIGAMLARGSSELAQALGLPGHDRGPYGHVMDRGR